MEKPAASFSLIPAEIRLRILGYTHLGPPETGGYDKRLGCLRIRDGRIVPRQHPMFDIFGPPPESIWFGFYPPTPVYSKLGHLANALRLGACSSSPATHGTSAPQCKCRVLPTQLYLVDKQMRREAVDVFYSNVHFDFYDDNLGSTLSFLRDVVPREGLARLRRLEFTMTEANCEGWASGAVSSGYPAATLEKQVAVPYWGGGPAPRFDYKNDWRAIVALLAEHADLPRLRITVDTSDSDWSFIDNTLEWEDSPDVSMFRFLYDFHIDVITAMCSLKGLGGMELKLCAFRQLEPWLEREVLGYERKRTIKTHRHKRRELNLWRRPRFYQVVPAWHDMNLRLEGSNYQPGP